MYSELFTFLLRKDLVKRLWKDGEFVSSILIGAGSFFMFKRYQFLIKETHSHLSDVLTMGSIIFGFCLASLLFYIEISDKWKSNEIIGKIAKIIVDWHVWTILCLLALIIYIMILWFIPCDWKYCPILYSLFVFVFMYIIFQMLNQILTIWWMFQKRGIFKE